MKSWKDALRDANEVRFMSQHRRLHQSRGLQVVNLDPSSHLGYELRHAALAGLNCHEEAVVAYDTMLLKIKESPDIHVRSESFYEYHPSHID